jgi:hypothetical protein
VIEATPARLDIATFAREGFLIPEGFLDGRDVAHLKDSVEGEIVPDVGRGGVRNLLDIPGMRVLAESPAVRALVEFILGPGAKPVRGILFDKTGEANWKVPWHQDVTIAVAKRVDAEGYGPWSVKAGVTHVQPPASVLEQMVSLRIHLDDCPEANGALKVIPGSHRQGKIAETRIAEVVERGRVEVCEVRAGGVLIMRPLLVHSSAPSLKPGHRRVIHFDFAAAELAPGLAWAIDTRLGAAYLSR